MFATMSGALAILTCHPENDFLFLKKLQQVMQNKTIPFQLGTHAHLNYRYQYEKFQNNDEEQFNNVDNSTLLDNITILDGNFIISYLDLPQQTKDEIAAEMNMSSTQLTFQIQQFVQSFL